MLVALVVPIAGLEFAHIYERQLLDGLERDMRNQSILLAVQLRSELSDGALDDPEETQQALEIAATRTRTRLRVLDADGALLADSHTDGAPEGPEPELNLLGRSYGFSTTPGRATDDSPRQDWPEVAARKEVRDALRGRPGSYTRVRDRHPEVLLFVAEPIRVEGRIQGVVYATRSTQPVLIELHRIRWSILKMLAIAVVICLALALLLAWTISRPLGRLARAAQSIAGGEANVDVPLTGTGEIRDLAISLRGMTARLSERAEANANFAADVAHEFKSPLTSIRGAAELLSEGAAEDPVARDKFLRNIRLDTERLDRLVSRLLELSRLEASEVSPVTTDLKALLSRLVDRVSVREQPVELTYESSRAFFDLREAEFELALRNLIENAIGASPDGEPVEVRVQDDGEAVLIQVSDHGPGIPKENQSRVFDRFFTTDAEHEGTGLGLAIVKTVAEAHGGTIGFESSAHGTTFSLRLPTAKRSG